MNHHVLVLGGNGKVARHLTPLLLKRGWAVTSVVRSAEQIGSVPAPGPSPGQAGKLTVIARSLEGIKSEDKAREVLDEVGADYVVWSAGIARPSLGSPHMADS